jgi:hypothetical protein
MHHAMRGSVALAAAALLSAITAPAQADKPDSAKPAKAAPHGMEREKPEAHEKSTQTRPMNTQAPGDRASHGLERSGEAREARGKSAEAHELAPGQTGEAPGKREGADPSRAPGLADDKGREQEREKRRQAQREALEQRFGLEFLQRPPVRAELRTHAWSMARLDRMAALAETITDADKRKKTIERLSKLRARETARHERRMEQLRNPGETVPASAHVDSAGKPQAPRTAEPTSPRSEPAFNQRSEKVGGGK